jgi:exodeoxyribonuclease V alpha subunit
MTEMASAYLAERFGVLVRTMHVEAGGAVADSAMVQSLASGVWMAMQSGHTALPFTSLADNLEDADDVLRVLKTSPMIAANELTALPLVYAFRHLYLHRFACVEARLALQLTQRNRALADHHYASLDPKPKDSSLVLNDQQLLAVKVGLSRQLLILTGGPGTGKTFTLGVLIGHIRASHPQAQIAGCAPTGKAAVRLAAARLPQGAEQAMIETKPLFDRVSTVHRLLVMARDFAQGLPFDWVVVDEATMLEAGLADQLFAALKPDCRLILAGDQYQLNSVQAGAVFAQACTLPDCVIRLVDTQRFSKTSGIGLIASAVLDERILLANDLEHCTDLEFLRDDQWASAVKQGYQPLLLALESTPVPNLDNACNLLAQLNRFRVLCASKSGAFSTASVNQLMAHRTRALSFANGYRGLWYPGRLVMITRNDEITGLMNGQTGLCLLIDDQLQVVFESDQSSVQAVACERMPAHEDAWGLTVHKSQGSEYDQVLFALPAVDSLQARRELVYTAITRAKSRLKLLGNVAQLNFSIAQRSERFSGLQARLMSL